MLALDTNVLARFVLADDPVQHQAAKAAMSKPALFISTTVLLELFWLMVKIHRLPKAAVLQTFADLVRLPNVTLEQPALVARALEWAAGGVDFGDALHLASARDCEALISFDRRFARRAEALGASPPVSEP